MVNLNNEQWIETIFGCLFFSSSLRCFTVSIARFGIFYGTIFPGNRIFCTSWCVVFFITKFIIFRIKRAFNAIVLKLYITGADNSHLPECAAIVFILVFLLIIVEKGRISINHTFHGYGFIILIFELLLVCFCHWLLSAHRIAHFMIIFITKCWHSLNIH